MRLIAQSVASAGQPAMWGEPAQAGVAGRDPAGGACVPASLLSYPRPASRQATVSPSWGLHWLSGALASLPTCVSPAVHLPLPLLPICHPSVTLSCPHGPGSQSTFSPSQTLSLPPQSPCHPYSLPTVCRDLFLPPIFPAPSDLVSPRPLSSLSTRVSALCLPTSLSPTHLCPCMCLPLSVQFSVSLSAPLWVSPFAFPSQRGWACLRPVPWLARSPRPPGGSTYRPFRWGG